MTSDETRFWAKVDRTGPDDCWEWQAARNPLGYGYFWDADQRKMVHAHRWAFGHFVERLPSKPPGTFGPGAVLVCHRCDNPPCVNPTHLYRGSHADNMEDKAMRSRQPSITGSNNPNAKLTPAQVAEIRRRYTGRYGEQSKLGREYGVNASAIRAIVLGKTWAMA